MITIDGSEGEGGGQMLRTSLALSLATGRPFRMVNIRAKRRKPGLMRQHLTAVTACAEVGSADVQGAEVGSRELAFVPGEVRAGDYTFSIGTAGSTMLVLQAVMPALLRAEGPSTLRVGGGTHARSAPPFEFFERVLLPIVNRMGPRVEARLERCGFYPAGGGRVFVSIQPSALRPVEIMERGATTGRTATALVSQLPGHIAERELAVVREKLGWEEACCRQRHAKDCAGPGNAVLVEIQSEHITEVFSAFGELGKAAEAVAGEAVDEARAYLACGAPVGPHLADQLLAPMALAGGGSFRTSSLTEHSTTNIEVIRRFLDVRIEAVEGEGGVTTVTIS